MEVIRGVENVARERGLSVVLSESGGRLTPGRTWADQVAARRPHGVILVPSGLDASQRALLTSGSIPFVVMDPAGGPGDDVPSVGATNWHGGLAATRHLIELGHTRIGAISGPARMMCSRARADGYRAPLETAGRPWIRTWSGRATSTTRRATGSAANCCAARTGRRLSSRATTSRRWGSTRRRGSWGCALRRTSAWSASTICQ